MGLEKYPPRVALFHCCHSTVPSPSRDNVTALRGQYPVNIVVKISLSSVAVSTARF